MMSKNQQHHNQVLAGSKDKEHIKGSKAYLDYRELLDGRKPEVR
jgi:hypothetical protein